MHVSFPTNNDLTFFSLSYSNFFVTHRKDHHFVPRLFCHPVEGR